MGAAVEGESANSQREHDFVLGEIHVDMRGAKVAVEAWDQLLGCDELDAVIAAEMATLALPPVDIAFGMALLGIDNERFAAFRHDVDALGFQPATNRGGLARPPRKGQAEGGNRHWPSSAIPRSMTLPTARMGNVNIVPSITQQSRQGGGADAPAA